MNLAHSYFHSDLCVAILVRAQYHSQHHAVINPWRMREGYGGRSVCVSVCVCVRYLTSCYIPG